MKYEFERYILFKNNDIEKLMNGGNGKFNSYGLPFSLNINKEKNEFKKYYRSLDGVYNLIIRKFIYSGFSKFFQLNILARKLKYFFK